MSSKLKVHKLPCEATLAVDSGGDIIIFELNDPDGYNPEKIYVIRKTLPKLIKILQGLLPKEKK